MPSGIEQAEEENPISVKTDGSESSLQAQPVAEAVGPSKGASNLMREVTLGKVTVNIGVGEPGEKVSRAVNLLESLTAQRPVRTVARKTNRDFNVRKNDQIGCKVTLRDEKAVIFLKKALEAVDFSISERAFDDYGNFSFGIAEHINIPGTQYDPSIGIYGMDVCVSVERKGYRVMRRKMKARRVPRSHRVSKTEAMKFIQDKFNVRIV